MKFIPEWIIYQLTGIIRSQREGGPTKRKRIPRYSHDGQKPLPPGLCDECGVSDMPMTLNQVFETNIEPKCIKWLIEQVKEVFVQEPSILELEAPINIVGDINGHFYDLMHIFNLCGTIPDQKYLFLGNLVDHGQFSVETMTLLLALKLKYPDNIYLLRGKHESDISYTYGFYDECKRRYSDGLWHKFRDMFNYMPICALVDERIFCVSGGIS